MNTVKIATQTFYIDDIYFDGDILKALVFDLNTKPDVESAVITIMTRAEAETILKARHYDDDTLDFLGSSDMVTEFKSEIEDAIANQFPGVVPKIRQKLGWLITFMTAFHVYTVYLLFHWHYIIAPVLYLVCMLASSAYAKKQKFI